MQPFLTELLEKYKNQSITRSEWDHLRAAIRDEANRASIEQDILSQLENGSPQAGWTQAKADAVLHAILSTENPIQDPGEYDHAAEIQTRHELPVARRLPTWTRYASAAAILIAIATFLFIGNRMRHQQQSPLAAQPASQIHGGQHGATLTLSDGSTIQLDSASHQLIPAQPGSTPQLQSNQLVYNPTDNDAKTTTYNAITTAKGKQYTIILPDGTKVYLNAATMLRYPTAFNKKERRVEVSGEAYFEVAKQADVPFYVSINGQSDIQVLGTSFNVNAYKDDTQTHTTLVEGSIRVIKAQQSVILQPGQQARTANGSSPSAAVTIEVIKNADIAKATAWKNGIFNFDDVGLRDMMRQLERWYDIEVTFGPNTPDVKFFGKIPRKVSLATVLEALRGFGLQYEMRSNRQLIVYK